MILKNKLTGPFYVIELEGNDGTGKTSLKSSLDAKGYHTTDRGALTYLTDETLPLRPQAHGLFSPVTFTVILTCLPETSLQRILARGDDPNDPYHMIESLRHYHFKYMELLPYVPAYLLIDTTNKTKEQTAQLVLEVLYGQGIHRISD